MDVKEDMKDRVDFSKTDLFIEFFDKVHESKSLVAIMASSNESITTAVYGADTDITWLLTNFLIQYPDLINAYLSVIIKLAEAFKTSDPERYEWYTEGLNEFLNDLKSKI